MAIDEIPRQDPPQDTGAGSHTSHTGKFVAIFAVLAALALAQLYTISRIGTMRESLETQQVAFQKTVTAQLEQKVATQVESTDDATNQELEALRKDVMEAKKRSGSASSSSRRPHGRTTAPLTMPLAVKASTCCTTLPLRWDRSIRQDARARQSQRYRRRGGGRTAGAISGSRRHRFNSVATPPRHAMEPRSR